MVMKKIHLLVNVHGEMDFFFNSKYSVRNMVNKAKKYCVNVHNNNMVDLL